MNQKSFNNVIISRDALKANYLAVQDKIGADIPMLSMIKADAYGHGAVEVAKALSEVGCTIFGVGEICEAIRLREADITGKILVMMGFEQEAAELFFEYNLTPVIYSWEAIVTLSEVAVRMNQETSIHFMVDTGMGRLGFIVDDLLHNVRKASELPGIVVGGMLSHFAEADTPELISNKRAIEAFTELSSKLKAEFSASCHLVNSAGMLNFPKAYFDMGRAGIILYGYHPAGGCVECDINLKQVMTFTTKVIQVRDFPAGVGISYGHTYKTEKPTKIAVLPVGYNDGYSRIMSNKAEVLVAGQRAPVVGTICMNLCMVDISNIENVNPGDEVVLLGSQGDDNISADEIASWIGSISYEVICMFGRANNRKYID